MRAGDHRRAGRRSALSARFAQIVSADIVGFDICGFSRFAEASIARSGASGVDDLARLWERAAAPQVDALIGAGFEVADVCGDGVIAWREAAEDPAPLLRRIEHGFAAAAPGLFLRTAAVRGEAVRVESDALGSTFAWASGSGVEALHGRLRTAPRRTATSGALAPAGSDADLAFQWERTGADIRPLATMFACLHADPWMWSDADRIERLVIAMAAAAARHDGSLEKVTHDDKGLMLRCAFAGLGRDAVLAAAAAAREALASYPDLGVAVDEGRVYFGPVRVGARQERTVHGASVNRAAKLAAVCVGEMALTAGGAPGDEALAAVGFAPGVTAGRWRTATPAVPPDRSSSDDLLVGRADELAILSRLVGDESAMGRVVVVEGEAGQGKSALLRGFIASLPPGALTVMASARPVGALREPWPHVLQALARRRFASETVMREGVADTLAAVGLALSEYGVVAHIGLDLFGPAPDLPPQTLRERLDRAFTALLADAGAGAVVVVDDAHWLDAEALRWVDLAARLAGAPRLVLARRPRADLAIADPPAVAEAPRVRLGALADDDARRLIAALRPDIAGRGVVLETMTVLAAGSPILLDQMARAWPAAGDAEFEAFAENLTAGVAVGSLLGRVMDVRLERLDTRQTQFLRRLVVAGPAAPAPAEDEDLAAGLVAQGLARVPAAGRLEVRHALVAEAVRRRTPGLLWTRLHAAAARALARAGTPEPAGVAAHWREAGAGARAGLWFARAGWQAERSAAMRPAVDLFQAAIDACPAPLLATPTAVGWRTRIANAAFAVGELARANAEIRQCLALAGPRRLWDRRFDSSLRLALSVRCEIATFTADLGAVISGLTQLRFMGGDESADVRGRPAALFGYAFGLARARGLARRILDQAAERGGRNRHFARSSGGLIHNCFGEWAAGEASLKEAISLAPVDRYVYENEVSSTLLALNYFLRGDAQQSFDLFEAIMRSARDRGNQMNEAWGLYGAAQALIALDRCGEAEPRLARAEQLLVGHIDRQSHLICAGLRVELGRRSGDSDAVLAAIEANLALAKAMPASNFGSFTGYAAAPLAALELARARPGDARLPNLTRAAIAQLARYAAVFPIGRPRLALCRALAAHAARDARAAAREFHRAQSLADGLAMAGEATLIRRQIAASQGE